MLYVVQQMNNQPNKQTKNTESSPPDTINKNKNKQQQKNIILELNSVIFIQPIANLLSDSDLKRKKLYLLSSSLAFVIESAG